MNKQELTDKYAMSISSLFEDIDVYAGDIADSMKEGEVTADELCDFHQIAADARNHVQPLRAASGGKCSFAQR